MRPTSDNTSDIADSHERSSGAPRAHALRERLRQLPSRGFQTFRDQSLTEELPHAAVLALLWDEDGDETTRIALTRRTTTLRSHSGQISFPGGKHDDTDADLLATALRETQEELGVTVPREAVVGRLDDAWSVSRRLVSTFVAHIDFRPDFVRSPVEVARIFTPSVQELLQPSALEERSLTFGDIEVVDQVYRTEGEIVWGLTSDILTELLDFFRGENGHRLAIREQELAAFNKHYGKHGTLDRHDLAPR